VGDPNRRDLEVALALKNADIPSYELHEIAKRLQYKRQSDCAQDPFQRMARRTRGSASTPRTDPPRFREYRRERPRDPEKARLLRERGTPEHLIGPERADDSPT
jgi:hypothetical protein